MEQRQIKQCLTLLNKIMAQDILGIYLFGSTLVGGLQKYSDIDLFVVVNRKTTAEEKKQLVEGLLEISGIYMKGPGFPIEMTIVVKSAVNPWHYPPHMDFQYGEWLREPFMVGNLEPWETTELPDLALLITQILLSAKTLSGSPAKTLLPKIPYDDFIRAIDHSLSSIKGELVGDTRNVLLTLARIWRTLETDTICSKSAAAEWCIPRLPKDYQKVLQRAKAICIGEENEEWDDLKDLLQPCVDFIYSKSKEQIALKQLAEPHYFAIKILT